MDEVDEFKWDGAIFKSISVNWTKLLEEEVAVGRFEESNDWEFELFKRVDEFSVLMDVW